MCFVPPLLEAAWYFQGVTGSGQQRWPHSRHYPCHFLQPVPATHAQRQPLPPLRHCEGCTGQGSRSKVHRVGLWSCFLHLLLGCQLPGSKAVGAHTAAAGHVPGAFCAGGNERDTDHVKGRMLSSAVPRDLCLGKEKASRNSLGHKSCALQGGMFSHTTPVHPPSCISSHCRVCPRPEHHPKDGGKAQQGLKPE